MTRITLIIPTGNAPLLLRRLPKNKNHDLCHDDAHKHGQRIDGGIDDRSAVTFDLTIDVVERHRIGSAAAYHTRCTIVPIAQHLDRNPTDEQRRQHGNQEAYPDPQESVSVDNGIEKIGSARQAQSAKIENDAELTQEEVGTIGYVCGEMETGAEGTHQNADDNRATGQTELDGHTHPREIERNKSEDATEEEAAEERRQMRIVELLHFVAQYLSHAFHSIAFAYDRQSVSQLQVQISIGQ